MIDFKGINAQLDMHAVVAWLGLKEDRAGKVLCPVHPDKHPSMKIYPHSVYCFACNASFDCIGLTAHIRNVSQTEACKMLCEAFALPFDVPLHIRQKSPQKRDITAEMASLWCEAVKRLLTLYIRQMTRNGSSCGWAEEILDNGFIQTDTEFYDNYSEDWRVETWLSAWTNTIHGKKLSPAV